MRERERERETEKENKRNRKKREVPRISPSQRRGRSLFFPNELNVSAGSIPMEERIFRNSVLYPSGGTSAA
jgi:hypothetical protein